MKDTPEENNPEKRLPRFVFRIVSEIGLDKPKRKKSKASYQKGKRASLFSAKKRIANPF
jgi:Tat protein secretion system quality control protein TatD with DNase activity